MSKYIECEYGYEDCDPYDINYMCEEHLREHAEEAGERWNDLD